MISLVISFFLGTLPLLHDEDDISYGGDSGLDKEFSEGRVFHHYRILNLINRGGMAEVFRALHLGVENFSKTVALKVLKEDFLKPDYIQMFVEEAKLVANLVHENICQIYHLGKIDNRYYIDMEFIDGVNLSTFLKEHIDSGRELPRELAIFIVSRICRALEYAHNKRDELDRPLQIVHLDVSPSNIMISFEGVVKLADFGIARYIDYDSPLSEEIKRRVRGKFRYMSPEQTRGLPLAQSSDIFSLGLVMYEIVTGTPLIQGTNRDEIVQELQSLKQHQIAGLLNRVSPELQPLLTGVFHPFPDERPDAGTLGTALEHSLYDRGYGPTNQTLRDYMHSLFGNTMRQRHELYRQIEEKIRTTDTDPLDFSCSRFYSIDE